VSSKTVFDHIGEIFGKQRIDYFDTLSEADRKTYTTFMINRFISMDMDRLPIVNEIQQFYDVLGPREHYLFLSQFFPKGKSYTKYVKAEKTEKHEPWLIELVAQHYGISKREALDYLTIYYATEQGQDDLRTLCRMHAITDKQLKKVKL
jgi:hypothetical protein